MSGKHHRAFAAALREYVPELTSIFRIKTSRRLIKEYNLRFANQADGN
jgi:hypothetical protein